jgi:hypothetical protein
MKIPILLFTLLFTFGLKAQEMHFSWSDEARVCLNTIYNLEFEKARIQLKALETESPNNLVRVLLADYIDFFYLMIKEDPAYLDEHIKLKSKRIDALEALDKKDPYRSFAQAEIKLHWALSRIRLEEYLYAILDLNKAFKELKQLEEQHPDFMPSKKTLGALYVGIGSIPPSYRSILGIVSSLDGDIDKGFELVETAFKHGNEDEAFIFRDETAIVYAYLLLYIGKEPQKAWAAMNTCQLNTQKSPLAKFIKSNLALRTRHVDEAIKLLQAPLDNKEAMNIDFLDFMLGEAYLYKLDPKATDYFETYIQNFTGKNYVKEALQKQAWSYLVQDDIENYQKNMQRIEAEGEAYSASDKSAQFQAKAGNTPNVNLLKARLLCDGGYFEKARSILSQNIFDPYMLPRVDQIEYFYRAARIDQLSGLNSAAKINYLKTIELGKTSKTYFACRAALEMGHIFEKEKNETLARKYFSLCLDLEPDEYRFSLHTSAKAGLRSL